MTEPNLIFGKYSILHRLAIGGMGEVFFAVQRGVRGFERPVILKSLLPDLAQDTAFVDQFLDEARVAATLNHPNLVSIFEVGAWGGSYFIAMEYIRGRHLGQVMRRAREQQLDIPVNVVARIIADASHGLHHAHTARDASGAPLGIVHRDVSPQNIMVRDDGVTKVVDFGIAKASNRSTRTATGVIKGKLAYMPPEQVKGQDVTPAVDQYALGVCFWELLTNTRLFRAENDLSVAKMVLEAPVALPSSLRAGVAPELDAIVMRMLDRAADRRFPSCAEAARVIDAYLSADSRPGQDGPAEFMKRLGTADLELWVTPSPPSGNFVINLSNPGAKAASATGPGQLSIDPALQPTDDDISIMSVVEPAPGGRKRLLWPAVGAGGLLLAVAIAAVVSSSHGPAKAPVPVEVPAPAPPAPVVMPTVTVAAPGKLVLQGSPHGAEVRVDGRVVADPSAPMTVSASVSHHVTVDAAGYAKWERDVTVGPGEEQRVDARLSPLAVAPRPVARPAPAPAAATAPAHAPAAEAGDAWGFVSIRTKPWTKVVVDDEPLGTTPIFKRKLSTGVHRLVMMNEGAGIHDKRTFTVTSDEVTKINVDFP